MDLVIGANGKLGRRVVASLLDNDRARPAVFVRDVESARQNFGNQVDIRAGDLNDPASILAAMEDVQNILICSPVHPHQVRQHNAVIDAAKQAGIAYIVKVSGLATFPGSYVDSGRWHSETEAYLADSGLRFTCLQPYFFMQNLGFQKARVLQSGKLHSGVAHAKIAMVDTGDIADAVTALFADPDLAPDETLPLTSRRALSYDEIASVMSSAWGIPVEFEPLSQEMMQDNLKKSGQPEWHIRILLQFNRAFTEGLGSQPHPALEKVLGRQPLELEESLKGAGVRAEDTDPFPS